MNKYSTHSNAHNSERNGTSEAERKKIRRRSEVRHGRIYEDRSESTIRAVTPDSGGSTSLEITALPSPTSFLPQSNAARLQAHDPLTSVSNTDEESTAESRRRKPKKKTKHQDTAQSDTSPNSFFKKTRERLNSITTAPSIPPRQDDSAISIGFPSVVQASVFPDMQDMRHTLPRTPRTAFSSDTTTAGPVRSPLMVESDSNKILHLMKTLCGRMHGILFYRPIGTTAWHSGYCAINVAPGSLVCQTKGDVTQTQTLIPDLRGCTVRTHYDAHAQSTHLSVVLPVTGFGYQLRPPVLETFESWLAALLCWQPLKPKGIHNKMAKPQSISMTDRQSAGSRRMSDISSPRSTAVVKSSQMLIWDGAIPAGSHRHQAKRVKTSPQEAHSLWRKVNCTLHENGTLRLLAEANATPIRSMKLNTLARCSIQRLDESILGASNCITVHPQYTVDSTKVVHSNPLILCLNSRVAFEAWFVLLQAMTVPELYGPEADAVSLTSSRSSEAAQTPRNMFRIERSLHVKIIEAKFVPESAPLRDARGAPNLRTSARSDDRRKAGIYADVLLGRDLRARTVNKPFQNVIFWAEEFCLNDTPSVVSSVSVVLKMGNPDEKEWTMITNGEYDMPGGQDPPDLEAIEVASHDPVYGRIDVPLTDLEQDQSIEKWWSLLGSNGTEVGQALIRFKLDENVVLMESEYNDLSEILHNFDNSLTSQIGQVLGSELKQLSDVLLDIFQCSDKVEEWINNLVEEEIDGIYREQPPTRMRFSGRIHSNDSYETAEHRELLVRDLSRSATMEANLLFRGNSLVTKALDAHMRRLSKDYLDRVLGDKLRSVVANDPNCEVDPNRIRSSEQLDRNWSTLIGLTSSIWQSIAASVQDCPPGLRNVLKHIRSCAEDRYGSFIRTVKYTSVSGFLFLRLLCPAILNPKLFGLLDDHPSERPRRTFTLIAKSLIVLANLTSFGNKEPWMVPMNSFLKAATPEFKIFIEEICSWTDSYSVHHEPQYQAAAQVRSRLPLLSREGLLSLPFLVDSPRALANLVDIWLENAPENITELDVDECIKRFHNICVDINQRTHNCMANAERAQEPNSQLERQWQKMLSEQPKGRFTHNPFEELHVADNDITALPQRPEPLRQFSGRQIYSRTGTSPIAEDGPENEPRREAPQRTTTKSTNSSNTSFEMFDEYRNRQGLRSRDGYGSNRGRFLEISNPRKGRAEHGTGDKVNRI